MARSGYCVASVEGGGGGGILFHFILSKTVDGVVVVNRNVSHYLDHQRFSRI